MTYSLLKNSQICLTKEILSQLLENNLAVIDTAALALGLTVQETMQQIENGNVYFTADRVFLAIDLNSKT